MKKSDRHLFLSCLLLIIPLLGLGQTGGIVFTDRFPIGLVSFSASVKLSAISNTNHVDGYVKQNGNAPFLFPVGHQGQYRPFGAQADGTLGAYFRQNPGTASSPSGAPFALTNKESILSQISTTEFWDINGANATQLTLTWNRVSNITELTQAQLPLLTIAGWNSTSLRWEAIPSLVDAASLLGQTSTLTDGSITTIERVIPNTYSVYTLAARTSATLPAGYGGKLEQVSCNQVQGWVWDKNYPNSTLTVELIEGTTMHGTTLASLTRPDLQQAGIGTGRYGFSLPLSASLIDGQSHQVSVRVKGSHYILEGANQVINCGHSGNVEVANCVEVKGWVWDKNNPSAAQPVELVEDNIVYGNGTANQYRSDLQQAGTGTGQYGFSLPIPVQLRDGKAHRLSVRVQNVSYTLANSPKSINCPLPQYGGNFEAVSCSAITGWVWDRNNPAANQTVELLEGTTVLATAVASTYREGLKSAGPASTGNYVFSIPTPASLKDGRAHALSVRVKATSFVLTNSPRTLTCASNDYGGNFEAVSCSAITGWVWDKNNPAANQTVELLEGTTVLATAVASTYREGLKSAGPASTGNYVFSIPTPASLKDGRAHALSVRVKATSFVLTNSPRTLTCASNDYGGNFEAVSCSAITGWVWDKNNPAANQTVELLEGTTVLATAVASTYREGLKSAGPASTGNYVFSIPTPASLKDGRAHALSVRVKATSFVLTNSPRTLTCASNDYGGNFEAVSCSAITGWVWDKNNPAANQTVELLEGTTVLATAVASTYREGLKSAGPASTGNYVFSIPTPASLKDGRAHALSVRVKATSFVLTNSPRTLTCASNDYGGNFEAVSCSAITGWVWDKNNPAANQTVELLEGTTVLATAVASTYREGLKSAGPASTGNYVFSIPTPASLKDGRAHALSVRVKATSFVLTNSPRTLTCASSSRLALFNDREAEGELNIFPNPTKGRIVATFGINFQQTVEISLVDLLGRIIWQKTVVGNGQPCQETIDFGQEVDGVYIFQLKKENRIESKRIILTR